MSYDPIDTAAFYLLAILAIVTLAAILSDVVLARWMADEEELEPEQLDALEREHLYAPLVLASRVAGHDQERERP